MPRLDLGLASFLSVSVCAADIVVSSVLCWPSNSSLSLPAESNPKHVKEYIESFQELDNRPRLNTSSVSDPYSKLL